LCNSVTVENQTEPYTAAMAQLLTKTDINGTDSSGSNSLLSLRKDFGKDLSQAGGSPTLSGEGTGTDALSSASALDVSAIADTSSATTADVAVKVNAILAKTKDDVAGLLTAASTPTVYDNKADNVNPKQEILSMGQGDSDTVASFEVSEPIMLSSWQTGYACPSADHQLFLTVSPNFLKDLLHTTGSDYTNVLSAGDAFPAAASATANTIYVSIKDVELHTAFVGPAQPFIPRSISLKFSGYQIATRLLTSNVVNESIVVPPSTRAVYVSCRQRYHDIKADREELGKASAGISEISGKTCHFFTDFQCQLGSAMAPTPAYGALDPSKALMSRPFNDYLSVIGKPLAMRGSTLSYADYCGSHNTNGASGPGLGDKGCVFMMRLLTPPNSMSNVLSVRGTLNGTPAADAAQELIVIVVNDQLWNMEYAPPAEIAVQTSVNPLI